MFTPPPSPTPSRTAPRKSSPHVLDESARFLFRDSSPSPPPSGSSSLTLAPTSSTSSDSTKRACGGVKSILDRFKTENQICSEPIPRTAHRTDSPAPQLDVKKRMGRRTTWTIVVVPHWMCSLPIMNTLSWESLRDWQPHKRHPDPQQNSGSNAISFPTPTSSGGSSSSSSSSTPTSSTEQTIPTVPSAQPVLPTPFPQPLDTSLSQNFSTQGCSDFFVNMTQTEPFRECRPFSLLQRSSSAFIQQAQTNLSALNAILWGTCNTDANEDTCTSNMDWFRDTLQAQCSQELNNQNVMVVNTLRGLQAYALMRDTACLVDQSTNSYCYIEAVRNTNPSDLYFYQLPLGIGLPASATPTCSACTKSVMQLYAQAQNVSALTTTYDSAARIADTACGSGYVQTASLEGGGAVGQNRVGSLLLLASLVVVSVGI